MIFLDCSSPKETKIHRNFHEGKLFVISLKRLLQSIVITQDIEGITLILTWMQKLNVKNKTMIQLEKYKRT
jgi:hypothetical protein